MSCTTLGRPQPAKGEDRQKGGGDCCLVQEDGSHRQETYGRECHMLRIEHKRLVEESAVASEQRIKDMKLMKEIIAARGEN